jgi:hypothetical protein
MTKEEVIQQAYGKSCFTHYQPIEKLLNIL